MNKHSSPSRMQTNQLENTKEESIPSTVATKKIK